MKIGLLTEVVEMRSLKYVFGELEPALAQRHPVVHRPLEYFYASPARQHELLERFLHDCDVIVGPIERQVLQTRDRITKHIPFIGLLLGTMSRGAMNLIEVVPHLKSTDVLVGNCTGDLEIVKKFFGNAQTGLLPFGFDESTYYPLDELQRQAIKAEMGFSKDDNILLYSGRLTLEKNIHTLLKIFSVLRNLVPNLHLLIAGEPVDNPFCEFGVYALNIESTLMKLVDKLQIPPERLRFLGNKIPEQLRDIYNIADILLNMTLHHDENFGYAQVEAMACGTPVVGTRWGGLKDTIKHGETGYQISTVVTGFGVKVSWWEAINRVVYLLNDKMALRQFRERCRIHAMENFSRARYSETLESILADCMEASKGNSAPLYATGFANQFWRHCQCPPLTPPPYRRSSRGIELYRELIAPFAGTTESHVPSDAALEPTQLLFLPTPVEVQKNGVIKIDDLIYPFELIVPDVEREVCGVILNVLKKEPIIKIGRLEYLVRMHTKSPIQNALEWMFEAGILLRTKLIDTPINPQTIGQQMSQPLFSIQSIGYMTDIVVISGERP